MTTNSTDWTPADTLLSALETIAEKWNGKIVIVEDPDTREITPIVSKTLQSGTVIKAVPVVVRNTTFICLDILSCGTADAPVEAALIAAVMDQISDASWDADETKRTLDLLEQQGKIPEQRHEYEDD
jgi:hypothetical protein